MFGDMDMATNLMANNVSSTSTTVNENLFVKILQHLPSFPFQQFHFSIKNNVENI
jgi:hypothetical protein